MYVPNCLILASRQQPAQQSAPVRGLKCGANDVRPPSEPDTAVSFTAELRQLKQKLQCERHNGRFCYINPNNGEHIFQDIEMFTLWAKKIVGAFNFLILGHADTFQMFGEATYTHPPSSKLYDHVSKRRRHERNPSTTVPPIHVHLPGLPFHEHDMPLSDRAGQRCTNAKPLTSSSLVVDLTLSSDDETPLISYPLIADLLHDLHEVMPLLNYPQYESALVAHGIVYMNNVSNISQEFFGDIVGMVQGAVGEFLNQARRLTRCAQKGKGKANVVKVEEKEN